MPSPSIRRTLARGLFVAAAWAAAWPPQVAVAASEPALAREPTWSIPTAAAVRLKVERAVWSGTGTSTTTLVANSLVGKVDLTCTLHWEGCVDGRMRDLDQTLLKYPCCVRLPAPQRSSPTS